MSSSAWPPELKAWVQQCLSKATASNKDAVNSELKQMLFRAHADGTINTTDWSKVELSSLKAQAQRTTHVPIPPPSTSFNPSTYLSSPAAGGPSVQPTPSTSEKKKKKKKNDGSAKSAFPTPYHFTSSAEEQEALARRAARFQKPAASSSSSSAMGGGVDRWFVDEEGSVNGLGMVPGQVGKRKMRGKGGLGYSGDEVMEVDPNVIDWDKHTIRGTSTKLEKSYLRLTSEPNPADVRPLHILQQTLQLLKRKWKDNHNYAYALDQFKSMRQDLTVQRIKNDFTVEVYEIHARIALEAKDLGEYNQCQTMLRQLYELGIKGHPQEFLSYRIMYLLHTRNRSDMATLLAQLTSTEKSDPGVKHALDVHAALATSNYVRFFRLFTTAPNMSGYIMDHFVERERIAALAIMSKGFMTLTLTYITTTLAFDSEEESDAFLQDHNAAVYVPSQSTNQSNNHWKPIKPPPLHERVWDCKKAHAACAAGISKYRVVDLKGQVD
uniref:Nuclear protein n=1 Tax=Kwoniella dejecticola CBS 10117 TaxID=1296121 RepID=A0A1A6A232_9TREE|nr:nuclear protein [Kwoniella dejecticola CBS 10117]OBR84094.1 nuclear protein [Kwoniella dejecticola CBS 10117]